MTEVPKIELDADASKPIFSSYKFMELVDGSSTPQTAAPPVLFRKAPDQSSPKL